MIWYALRVTNYFFFSESHHVYSCNQTHDFKTDYRGLQINDKQAFPSDPTFKVGMDYIFFCKFLYGELVELSSINKVIKLSSFFLATSNGLQNSLKTASTKCTMVFRIHVCEAKQHCPVPLCPSFGREKGMRTLVNIKT